MTNEANKWIKKARKKEIQKRGGKCKTRGCNRTKDLVFAHTRKTPIIDARKKGEAGRKERYYDVINHPKSYKLSCHEHNVKMDNRRRHKK